MHSFFSLNAYNFVSPFNGIFCAFIEGFVLTPFSVVIALIYSSVE